MTDLVHDVPEARGVTEYAGMLDLFRPLQMCQIVEDLAHASHGGRRYRAPTGSSKETAAQRTLQDATSDFEVGNRGSQAECAVESEMNVRAVDVQPILQGMRACVDALAKENVKSALRFEA